MIKLLEAYYKTDTELVLNYFINENKVESKIITVEHPTKITDYIRYIIDFLQEHRLKISANMDKINGCNIYLLEDIK